MHLHASLRAPWSWEKNNLSQLLVQSEPVCGSASELAATMYVAETKGRSTDGSLVVVSKAL